MKRQTVSHDPATLLNECEVLVGAEEIQRRIDELATHVNQIYANRELVVVVVLKGALHFASDLVRRLTADVRLEFVRASSYLGETEAVQEPVLETFRDLDIEGKDVLLVDDVLDQGATIHAVRRLIDTRRPKSVRWAVLLLKDGGVERAGLRPEFVGFEIPDDFVIGYGLDHEERFRQLPDILLFEPRRRQPE